MRFDTHRATELPSHIISPQLTTMSADGHSCPEPLHAARCFACNKEPPACRFVCEKASCRGPGGEGFRHKWDRNAVELCLECMDLTCRWCGHKSSEDALELVDTNDNAEDSESSHDEEGLLPCECGRKVNMRVYVSDSWMCFRCAADHYALHCAIFSSLTV